MRRKVRSAGSGWIVIIESFQKFGGKQSEVAAFRKLLEHLAINAPHSGQPYSEELLFGIGGGIGFAYFVFERAGTHPVYIGTRIHTKETERPEFLQTIASRLNISVHVQNSSSATAAASNLRSNFEQGRTPIVWLDASRLPYLGLGATIHAQHAVVVYGIDEDRGRVLMSDRCPDPVSLSLEEFRHARESSWSPKYRAMIVHESGRQGDVRSAVDQGIRECMRQMNDGLGITNFGFRGMEKWATVLTSTREKKSWLKIFPPGPALFDSLFSIWCQIRLRGHAGNAYRAFYADFLDEASEVISKPGLRNAAELYRESDRIWGELADAHLPASVPQFEQLRQLAIERKELFETRGMAAFDDIAARRREIERISGEIREQFPLTQGDTRSLLNDLRQRILRLKEQETECVRAVESAMGPGAAPEPPAGEGTPVEQLTNP